MQHTCVSADAPSQRRHLSPLHQARSPCRGGCCARAPSRRAAAGYPVSAGYGRRRRRRTTLSPPLRLLGCPPGQPSVQTAAGRSRARRRCPGPRPRPGWQQGRPLVTRGVAAAMLVCRFPGLGTAGTRWQQMWSLARRLLWPGAMGRWLRCPTLVQSGAQVCLGRWCQGPELCPPERRGMGRRRGLCQG